MKFFHTKILFITFTFGLALGCLDAFFDWFYHYEGESTYLVYLITDFPVHEVYWRGLFLLIAILFGLFVSYYFNQTKESESFLNNIFDNIVPICITNNDYEIIKANKSYYRVFGVPEKSSDGLKCYNHRPGPKCQSDECPLEVISKGGEDTYICESKKEEPDKITRTFMVYATSYKDKKGKQAGIIEYFQDITARKELEGEKEQLIGRLNSSLAEVKKLSGFLPICATCKKVRDDKGYWKQIESYISERSDTEFSHSICPECAAKYYEKISG